jgi:hypothetical protein
MEGTEIKGRDSNARLDWGGNRVAVNFQRDLFGIAVQLRGTIGEWFP